MREESGYTLKIAGHCLERSAPSLSIIEKGMQFLRLRKFRHILDTYGAPPDLHQALMTLAEQEQQPGWWNDFKDIASHSDLDYASLEKAHPDAGDITYDVDDLLTCSLEPASFDLVSAVASLHHMDARSGLVVLRNLVAPGGTLVVVGLAKPDFPKDIPHEPAALVVNRIQPQPQDPDDVPKPPIIWPPPERYTTMRPLATELLPGVRWQRHLLWRYSLTWMNPA